MASLLDLLGQTWPARLAQSAWSAAKLPGDVYAGRTDPLSDEGIGRAADLGGLVMGGTFAGAPAGALGAGPVSADLWHGISKVKLPRPVAEMEAGLKPSATPIAEKTVTPADLQGNNWLLPAWGDRSAAGQILTSVGDTSLRKPVELQGGAGYMPAHGERGAIWASGRPVIGRIESAAKPLAESGEVYFPYTAMGERSVDFSHHVSDTLVEMARKSDISGRSAAAFDRAMKQDSSAFPGVKEWPGINSPKVREYMADAGGDVRNKFAKLMDTANFQEKGFPSVAEARFAVTDPRLLNVPTGSSGIAISRIAPGAPRPPSLHRTYEEGLPGQYVGGFGTQVPKEIMFPDMISALEKTGKYQPVQYDYLMQRGTGGMPSAQRTNQQWVDSVSNFLRSRGLLPAVGGAAVAPALMADKEDKSEKEDKPKTRIGNKSYEM